MNAFGVERTKIDHGLELLGPHRLTWIHTKTRRRKIQDGRVCARGRTRPASCFQIPCASTSHQIEPLVAGEAGTFSNVGGAVIPRTIPATDFVASHSKECSVKACPNSRTARFTVSVASLCKTAEARGQPDSFSRGVRPHQCTSCTSCAGHAG